MTNDPNGSQEKKIFIDEDWKAQVAREREEARRKAEAAPEPEETPETAEAPAGEAAPEAPPEEASPFQALVQSLATQALFALGAIAPRGQEQVQVDIQQAQFIIDMLAALREKTQGNLDEEESALLNEALSELQRVYVLRAQQVQESSMRQAGVNPNDLKGQGPVQ